MNSTSNVGRLPCLKISVSGASGASCCSFSSWNTGLSCNRRRITIAAMVTSTLLRKTSRQAHDIRSSSGSSWTRIQTIAPSAVPRAAPVITSAEGPGRETDGIGTEAGEDTDGPGHVREEQLAEDEGRGGAVDDEVVLLERGADQAG